MDREKLQQYADVNDTTVEEVQQQLDEILEERFDGEDEGNERLAFMVLRSRASSSDFTPGGGDTETYEMLTIGHGGLRTWSQEENSAIIAHVIAQNEEGKTLLGAIICKREDFTDSDEFEGLTRFFSPLQTIKANLTGNESDSYPYFVLNSDPDGNSNFQEIDSTDFLDYDNVGQERKERQEWLNENYFPETTPINNLPSVVSEMEDDFETGGLSLDLHRVQGIVVDYFNDVENDTYIYTVQDDSVMSYQEYPDEVTQNDERPGMTVWATQNDMVYEEDSFVDIYGSFSVNTQGERAGEITMSCSGIVGLPGFAEETDLDVVERSNNNNSGNNEEVDDSDVSGTSFL